MSWIKRHKKLALFLALALIFLGWQWQRSQFTPERWAARPGERHHIVDDLLTQYGGLKGMSQERGGVPAGTGHRWGPAGGEVDARWSRSARAFCLSHRELRVGMGLPVPLSGGRDRDGEQDLCGLRPEKARLDLWGKEGFKTGWKENLEAI